jgi:hypothetical protein
MTVDIAVKRTVRTVRYNVVSNPSFETDVNNWTPIGSSPAFIRDSGQARFGTYSAKVTATFNGGVDYKNDNFFSVSPSRLVTCSYYVYNTVEHQYYAKIQWYSSNVDGALLSVGQGILTIASANTWTRISGLMQAPPGANFAKAVISTTLETSAVIYLDGVLCEVSDTLGDYFDGSYAPAYTDPIFDVSKSWDGTAHASTSTLRYGTRYAYAGVKSLSFNGGRRTPIDMTASGSCSFEVLNPSYFPNVNDKVEVFSGSHLIWLGYVNDSVTNQGIARNTDVLSVSCESYLARAGRAYIETTVKTNQLVTDLLNLYCAPVGLDGMTTPDSYIYASHSAFSGSLLNYIQRLQSTSFAHVKENGEFIRLITREQPPYTQRGSGFTDSTSPTSTQIRYDVVKFSSLTELSYDTVRVEPEILGAVEVGDATRTFSMSTYSPTTPTATALAQYVLDIFTVTNDFPNEISFLVNKQPNDTWALILDYASQVGEFTGAGGAVAQAQTIEFEERTYSVVILGFTFSGTPESARVTFYLAPSGMFPALTLDDSRLGQLDYSRLG